jgi:uncharacterized protein YcaQ
VRGYRAGDLERRYPELAIEEDFFVNYGFLPRGILELLHPRTSLPRWSRKRAAQAATVLEFVRERGVAHPRDVDAEFAHGRARNWFGGSSRASTQLPDAMHYREVLRVARRESGTRLYAVREPSASAVDRDAALDALVAEFGYVRGSPPREVPFRRALAEQVQGMREFLGLRAPADLASARRRAT